MSYTILALTADWHVNDMVGLCPPIFQREESEGHWPSRFQSAIWEAWLDYWQVVENWKKKLDAPVYAIACGDLGDLNKYSNAQLISPLRNDVERAMLDCIAPVQHIPELWFIVRGTASHTGAAGEIEEWLAKDLDNSVPAFDGKKSWWVWEAEIEGVKLAAAHHPPTGTKLANMRGDAVARMCRYLAAEYDLYGVRKPDLAFWAHRHWLGTGRNMGIWGWMIPPFKGLGEYGRRIGITLPNPVGGLIVILPGLDGSRWTVTEFQRMPPLPEMWDKSHLSQTSTSAPKNYLTKSLQAFRNLSNRER